MLELAALSSHHNPNSNPTPHRWWAWAALLCAALCPQMASAQPVAEPAPFLPLLSTSELLVGARLMGNGLVDGRYATVQTRLAHPVAATDAATTTWRVLAEHTHVVDCLSPQPGVATVLVATNTQANPYAPPQWQATRPPQVPSSFVPRELVFAPLPAQPNPLQEVQAVQAPGELRAAAAFACRAAMRPELVADVAKVVQRTAGLPDVQHWWCTLAARGEQSASPWHVAVSDEGRAVLLNDTWVSGGVLSPAYVAVASGGLDVRLLRSTGALRLVSRADMATVATGQCQATVVPWPGTATPAKRSGW